MTSLGKKCMASMVSLFTLMGTAAWADPVSFKIGGADFTPSGWAEFTSVYRSATTGGEATPWNAIPYKNTALGKIGEVRFTSRQSRLGLKINDMVDDANVTGYLETDFAGNQPGGYPNVTNSETLRLRLYWVDVSKSKWEFLAGQSWSYMTPNRVGLSPLPADLSVTKSVDLNIHVGLTYTRAPQIRAAYHANENWTAGLALENPEQFANNQVTFGTPDVSAQLTSATNVTPNPFPDVIPKIAFDKDANGKHFHVEAVGLLRTFRVVDQPTGGNGFTSHHNANGTGVAVNSNLEAIKGTRLIANYFYSEGGARYLVAQGPDVVALPSNGGTNVSLSPVRARADLFGVETDLSAKNSLAAYFGEDYFYKNAVGTIGFGGTTATNVTNHTIRETTAEWGHTFWKDPQHGALLLLTQYSYVVRQPFTVAPGTPGHAIDNVVYITMRYMLP